MKRVILPLILAFAFYGESIFVDLLSPEAFGPRMLTPHFLLVLLVLMGIYYFRNRSIIYAAVFGLLFDVYYTELIGIYLFLYPIAVYAAAKMAKILQTNIITALLIVAISMTLVDGLVYGSNLLIFHSETPLGAFVSARLAPSLVLNLAFFIIVFYPFTKWLHRRKKLELDD